MSTDPHRTTSDDDHRHEVGRGMLLAMGLAVGVFLLAFVPVMQTPFHNASIGFAMMVYTVLGIGLVQALWIAPLVFWYRRKGRMGQVKGLLIGAAFVFLLNAACWGFALGSWWMR